MHVLVVATAFARLNGLVRYGEPVGLG